MASQELPADSNEVSNKESEELTREKLILKYKTLMALTNKIKTARNEALAENGALKSEIEVANERIQVLTKQNLTAEEMLAALTEHKLKMAMEIDDLKKEKQSHYAKMKESSLKEIESLKMENDQIREDNNDLLLKLKEKEQSEMQLQNDVKKLHENNENVIILYSEVRKEKLDLQKKLEEISCSLNQSDNKSEGVFEFLSKQFSKKFDDLNSLKCFFENEIKTYCKYQCAEEMNVLLDENLNLKNQLEHLIDSVCCLSKEKESTESNLLNLSCRLDKLKSELMEVTSDRDQILNNLESVRLETKQLIENSEKLADELENSKADRIKNEHELNSLIERKNNEIERLQNQLIDLRLNNEDLNASLLSYKEYILKLDRNQSEYHKEKVKHFENDDEPKSLDSRDSDALDESIRNEITPLNIVLSNVGKLFKIRNTFNDISGHLQNINLMLLEKEVELCQDDLLKMFTRNNGEGEALEPPDYTCYNVKCSCVFLKNFVIKIHECLLNYEKLLSQLQHDLDIVNEEKLDNSLNTDEVHRCFISQNDKVAEMKTFLSKIEEYNHLNNLLEKKILICKEELQSALRQLHNTEGLETLMQLEIHSLKKQLSESLTEQQLLNNTVNDKLKEITRLEQELISEQSKSCKFQNDLKSSQKELDETKITLKEKNNDINVIKNENISINAKLEELREINKNLKIDNESLNLNINNILKEQNAKRKDDDEREKIILDLKCTNNQLEMKLSKMDENNAKLNEKLNAHKIRLMLVTKDIVELKEQISLLQVDTSNYLGSLQHINQKVLELFKDHLYPSSSSLLKDYYDLQVKEKEAEKLLVVKDSQITELNKELKEVKEAYELNDTASKMQSLETNLALSKQELATAHLEINHLMEEFTCYKVRAQALLSKQKSNLESHGEKEAKEQVEKLNAELETIRSKLDQILIDNEALKSKLSTINSEKEITDKKYDDISRALHQKIIDYDALNTEYNAFKLSTDTLIHNGKIVLEEKYKNEIDTKESIINQLKHELKEKHMSHPVEKITEDSESVKSAHVEEILLEREEGEGSETAATSFVDRNDFVPLDVLISHSEDGDENQVALLQEQVNMLNAELISHDVRCKHLSSLLREAEKESARNSQQNSVLKEEVRRLERCLERQPLVANTEYLKNIVFKFLTLQSTDEKSRLVPVLDSILKLSPEETHKLNEIARGEGSSRWSNYLQSWTGLG